MDNFTKGISNLTGPDPNHIFIRTKGTAPAKSKKKKSRKSRKSEKPKVGIGRVDNITTAYEFESDNLFVDLKVRMSQARVSLDISNDG